MNGRERARRRRWADVAVIAASAFAIVWAIWVYPRSGPGVNEGTLQWTHFVGGALGFASIFVALRSVWLARALLLVGGIVLVVGFVTGFNTPSGHGVVTMLLPAIVLLAMVPFVGPMPTPEEEGMRR